MNMMEAYEHLHGIKWEDTVPSVKACWADAWNLAIENEREAGAKERGMLLRVEVAARKFARVFGNGQPKQLEDAALWCRHELKALDDMRSNLNSATG